MEETKYSTLGAAFGRFLCVVAVFTLATQISNSFFNIFLLRATGGSGAMMWYNLLLACVQPPAMLAAVWVVRRFSTENCMRTGIVMHMAAYLILTVDGGASEALVYGISMLFSIGNGFYFTGYTPLLLSYTGDQNRDTAQGAMGFLSILGQLLLPLMTGFFINSFGNLTGYRILFALSAALLLGGVLLSFRFYPAEKPRACRHSIRTAARLMLANRRLRRSLLLTLLNAMLTSVGVYSSLIVFALLKKESVMGVMTTLCAIISMLAALGYGRAVSVRNRGRSILLGAGAIVLATVVLLAFPSFWGYVFYALLNAAASCFASNPAATVYFSILQNDERLTDFRAEVHALREFFVTTGRALPILPALFLADAGAIAVPMMLLIAALQIPAALIVIHLERQEAG